jgi:hypothetical protein
MILQEFSLTSIAEAQKSTSMNRSMKRLSWITVGLLTVEFFYLLMFVAVCISPADVCCEPFWHEHKPS